MVIAAEELEGPGELPGLAALVGADDLDVGSLRLRYAAERDRRLRKDANDQYVEVTAEFSNYREDPDVEAGLTRAPVRDQMEATVIGAGFSGLLAAARLREAGLRDVRLIDSGGDVGGTWYWNRYPGAQCDIDATVYLPLLEELGYVPQDKYAYGPDILEHARRIARHFGLYEHALLQTEVDGLRWDATTRSWWISTNRGDRLQSRFVVIANGALSKPKLPAIEGINEYRGYSFHSSRWDYTYTGGTAQGGLQRLADKRVGVIGTGATALQIVPHLARSAQQLYVFQRTPAVVGVRNNRQTDPAWQASLTPGWQRRRIENFTAILSGADVDEDLVADSWTDIYRNITARVARHAARRLGRDLSPAEYDAVIQLSDMVKGHEVRSRIARTVDDPRTAEALKPWYYLYCKRIGFHDEYLAAFNRPNVELVDTHGRGVQRLTAGGVVVEGREYEVDCLIFATGFEVGTSLGRRTGYDPVGRDGVRLTEAWSAGPRTLHGMHARGFPNLFMMGIVQNATTINFTHLADEQSRHLAYVVTQTRAAGDSACVEATEDGVAGWLAEMRAKASGAARVKDCTPSYSNSEGDPDNPHSLDNIRYGGGPLVFFRMLADWRASGVMPGLVVA
ncbi:NAD(P)/FAD-dependent oxidoreductase [Dactylosporangium salmoneum]|uniref:NAD(P)/FAD-dependent oxidoreductase n=1 Tax=Dactylosporangium salmoneum TaxID=53361 RepID=A0ABP5U855_9ACTN